LLCDPEAYNFWIQFSLPTCSTTYINVIDLSNLFELTNKSNRLVFLTGRPDHMFTDGILLSK